MAGRGFFPALFFIFDKIFCKFVSNANLTRLVSRIPPPLNWGFLVDKILHNLAKIYSMKNKKTAFYILLSSLFIYLMFSFGNWDFNPDNWGDSRYVCSFVIGFCSVVIIFFQNITEDL